jgi:hypothetical protein
MRRRVRAARRLRLEHEVAKGNRFGKYLAAQIVKRRQTRAE